MIKFLHKLQQKQWIQWTITIIIASLFIIFMTIVGVKNNRSFKATFYDNQTARIDIIPETGKNIEIKVNSEGSVEYPEWLKNVHGQGVVLNIPITKQWENYPVKISLNQAKKVNIIFRAPWLSDGNNNIPIFVNYKNLKINGEAVAIPMNISHKDNFQKSVFAKKGILEFDVDIKIPQLTIRDIIKNNTINPYVLFSIFVVLLLILRKAIHYCVHFYRLRYSRVDVVFLAVFFVLLFLPMSYISNAEKSKQENRMLAPKPQLSIVGSGVNSYGEKFNAWYNDRFFGRDWLITLHGSLNFILPKYAENKLAIKAPDDTIFSKGKLKILSTPISHEMLEEISKNIAKLQQFAEKNNIELYIMIPPAKEDLFKVKLKDIFADIEPKESVIYDLQKYILEKNKLEIIYPRDVYFKDYNDFTYYKTDHHWTEFGAFLGYQELIEVIRKNNPDIVSLSEDDFDIFYKNKPRLGKFVNLFDRPFDSGSDCGRLGIKSLCPLQYQYRYYNHKNRNKLKVKFGPLRLSRITHYDKGIPKNVTLLANSYGGFLMEFLPYNFQNVQFLRANNSEKGVKNYYDMKRFEKHILNFHTDILIICIHSSLFNDLKKLYKKD